MNFKRMKKGVYERSNMEEGNLRMNCCNYNPQNKEYY